MAPVLRSHKTKPLGEMGHLQQNNYVNMEPTEFEIKKESTDTLYDAKGFGLENACAEIKKEATVLDTNLTYTGNENTKNEIDCSVICKEEIGTTDYEHSCIPCCDSNTLVEQSLTGIPRTGKTKPLEVGRLKQKNAVNVEWTESEIKEEANVTVFDTIESGWENNCKVKKEAIDWDTNLTYIEHENTKNEIIDDYTMICKEEIETTAYEHKYIPYYDSNTLEQQSMACILRSAKTKPLGEVGHLQQNNSINLESTEFEIKKESTDTMFGAIESAWENACIKVKKEPVDFDTDLTHSSNENTKNEIDNYSIVCKEQTGTSIYEHKYIPLYDISRKFSCEICKAAFRRKDGLKRHYLIHTGEKSFSCGICNKAFTLKSVLRSHIHVHVGVKLYSCHICNNSFTEGSGLRRHLATHSNERNYKCGICNKAFNRKGYMRCHMRSHTGEKPFSCSICHKKFVQCGALKQHIRTHTGDKRFKCVVCNRLFSQNGGLKEHMRTHTGEKPYSCNICGNVFSISSGLRKHKLRRHKSIKIL